MEEFRERDEYLVPNYSNYSDSCPLLLLLLRLVVRLLSVLPENLVYNSEVLREKSQHGS